MAVDFWQEIDQRTNSLILHLVLCVARLFDFETLRRRIFRIYHAEKSSKVSHQRAISELSKIAIFTLFMCASPLATAYGLSIPDDPINDSVIVRLETNSINPRYVVDAEITNWWVEAGSTGFGSGQSDYFSSGALGAPVMVNMTGTAGLPAIGVQVGTSNALIINLPINGDLVFLSIWLKRQDRPWERELISVVKSASTTTPTAKVERNRYSYQAYFFGDYVWDSASMASWYQVWVNDDTGTNVYNKWYRHNEVCINTRRIGAKDCGVNVPYPSSPPFGTFWVRAWSLYGGYGPWSEPAIIDHELSKKPQR